MRVSHYQAPDSEHCSRNWLSPYPLDQSSPSSRRSLRNFLDVSRLEANIHCFNPNSISRPSLLVHVPCTTHTSISTARVVNSGRLTRLQNYLSSMLRYSTPTHYCQVFHAPSCILRLSLSASSSVNSSFATETIKVSRYQAFES